VFTLCKEERLRGERVISNLFENGQSFFQPPYRVHWIGTSEAGIYPVQFAVSVPKRRFKRAVKRNLLKRRTREAFRNNKQILHNAVADCRQVQLMVVYASGHILPYTELEASMKKILQHIARQYVEPV
jgi:ribonuclease P protein component